MEAIAAVVVFAALFGMWVILPKKFLKKQSNDSSD